MKRPGDFRGKITRKTGAKYQQLVRIRIKVAFLTCIIISIFFDNNNNNNNNNNNMPASKVENTNDTNKGEDL